MLFEKSSNQVVRSTYIDKNQVAYWKQILGDFIFEYWEDADKLVKLPNSALERPYLFFLFFSKGYQKMLGKVICQGYPLKVASEEFLKGHDIVLFVTNVNGQVITFFSSKKGLPK